MNNVEVLLISAQSRQEYLIEANGRASAGDLGIRCLAAYLNQNNILTEILPAHLNTERELISLLTSSPNLKIIGLSINVSSLQTSIRTLKIVSDLRPSVPIVVGGYLPTFSSERLLRTFQEINFVIRGEGELPMRVLYKQVIKGGSLDVVPSLSWRAIQNGEIIHNPQDSITLDLDQLPLPLRTISDMPKNSPDIMISASRGCYAQCSFCSIPSFGKNGWRGRNPEAIAEEIFMLKNDFNTNFLNFVDDSFFGNNDQDNRARQLRDALSRRRVRIPFRISMRANDVTEERIRLLKEAGLV